MELRELDAACSSKFNVLVAPATLRPSQSLLGSGPPGGPLKTVLTAKPGTRYLPDLLSDLLFLQKSRAIVRNPASVGRFLGTAVRPIARVLVCLVCSTLPMAGCAGMPVFHHAVAAIAPPDESGTADTPGDSAAEGFAHDARRVFPEPGWWCSEFEEWLSPARADKGYTIVLPGVEGTSCRNISIARGLVEAGHPAAIEVRDWTTGNALLWPYHLMGLARNQQQAREIARQIVVYQDRYPARPVTLIGHSGGAAMAVLILEALPADRHVRQVVLLAAAIAPDHDLSIALARTERGISSWGRSLWGRSIASTRSRQALAAFECLLT